MSRQPGLGGQVQASLLLLVHHLQWITEPLPNLLLYLAEDEPSPSTHDDVELVAAGPGVLRKDPVTAQAVPPDRTALGAQTLEGCPAKVCAPSAVRSGGTACAVTGSLRRTPGPAATSSTSSCVEGEGSSSAR